MQLARILTEEGPVAGEHVDGAVHTEEGVYEIGVDGRLLPPCEPTALYCIGENYAEAGERIEDVRPASPTFFLKPPASLLAHGEPIPYPSFTDDLSYAGELAVVLDRRCRNLDPAEVSAVIRGYAVMNDVDAYDQPSLTARKAFDGSAPLGPWIETALDPSDVDFRARVNGETRLEGHTERMLFDVPAVLSFLSKRFTFRPGDVVAFGCPGSPGAVAPGDTIEITYDGIGTLRNTVTADAR